MSRFEMANQNPFRKVVASVAAATTLFAVSPKSAEAAPEQKEPKIEVTADGVTVANQPPGALVWAGEAPTQREPNWHTEAETAFPQKRKAVGTVGQDGSVVVKFEEISCNEAVQVDVIDPAANPGETLDYSEAQSAAQKGQVLDAKWFNPDEISGCKKEAPTTTTVGDGVLRAQKLPSSGDRASRLGGGTSERSKESILARTGVESSTVALAGLTALTIGGALVRLARKKQYYDNI